MQTTEKIVAEQSVYDGKVIRVKKYTVVLPDGKTALREEVEHNGGACVLAVVGGLVYLVRQYRLSVRGETLELPAGKLEKGEDPYACAAREITEETGLKAGTLKKITSICPSPGYSNEFIHIYYAEDVTFSEQKLDEDEFLNVVKLPVEECFKMVESGEIFDGKTVAALLWLKTRYGK